MGATLSKKSESFSVVSTADDCSDVLVSVYHDDEQQQQQERPCFALFGAVRRKQDPLKLLGTPTTTSTSRRSFSSCTSTFLSTSTRSSTTGMDPDDEDESSSASSGYNTDGCVSAIPKSSSWSTGLDEPWYSYYTQDELNLPQGELPTSESDLRPSQTNLRTYHVVTTAALPWMTGTAVNPLLRAAHLSQLNRPFVPYHTTTDLPTSTVTLVLPWLESSEDRLHLYGNEWKDKTRADQDAYIRDWLAHKAELPLEADLATGGIQIQFYNARWHKGMNSIFAMGDIESSIPDDQADCCILEEPEHLNFYRAPSKDWWTEKFNHVVGIGHTNYKAYVREQFYLMSPVVGVLSSWMVRAYCHKLVKLSSVLQTYAPEKEVVCNVHGIRSDFLKVGRQQDLSKLRGIYFIGKLLWAKGFDRMIELQVEYRKVTGHYFDLDIVGSGPDQTEIERAFYGKGQPSPKKPSKAGSEDHQQQPSQPPLQQSQLRIPKSRYEFRKEVISVEFQGRHDHADFCQGYKIFVNPSLTEVLCTTTAEALAMNKFALVPAHPSNVFFQQFPNCLQYQSRTEFASLLQYALSHDPEPLSSELQYVLTWEAATERCLDAAAISRRDAMRRERVGKAKDDAKIAQLHYQLGKGVKGDVIRKVLGGGPVSDQAQYGMQAVQQQQQQPVEVGC